MVHTAVDAARKCNLQCLWAWRLQCARLLLKLAAAGLAMATAGCTDVSGDGGSQDLEVEWAQRIWRTRAGGRTTRTPRPAGASRMLRGLMLCMKKILATIFFATFTCNRGKNTPRHISSSRAHSEKIPTATPTF